MTPLLPGSTIGILGGGQLARMLALEARRMGYRVAVLDPDPDGPAGQVADLALAAPLDERRGVLELAGHADLLTLDTEHVPAAFIAEAAKLRPVCPGPAVMAMIQDRLAQRRFLADHGLPQPCHAPVDRLADLATAVGKVGLPAVLKTRRSGYDGKGQARIREPGDCEEAWRAIGGEPAVLEAFVDFTCEVSVVLARDRAGLTRLYPVVENEHVDHVLRRSIAPARVGAGTAAAAGMLAKRVATAMEYVGVMAVELFVTREGSLLVNEIAPRTHNSGHYTLGACATSQFGQHLRAICGLPLADSAQLRPAVMLNLMGELWSGGAPDWTAVLRHPAAELHLYGKRHAAAGRKMGHVLVTAGTAEQALAIAEEIDRDLYGAAGACARTPRQAGAAA